MGKETVNEMILNRPSHVKSVTINNMVTKKNVKTHCLNEIYYLTALEKNLIISKSILAVTEHSLTSQSTTKLTMHKHTLQYSIVAINS